MANRVREFRNARGWSIDHLAEETGISTSLLSRIETGQRGLTLEKLIRIARALEREPEEVSDDFSLDDIEQAKRLPLSAPAISGDVANLAIRGGLGLGSVDGVSEHAEGQLYSDHVSGYWSFPDSVKAGLRNLASTYSLPVIGDSMEPTLKSGSFVFVDMTHTVPQPEDIYACDYGDGLSIKRLQLIPRSDRIRVASDNPHYSDHELRREDVRVYGRVVAWFQWRG